VIFIPRSKEAAFILLKARVFIYFNQCILFCILSPTGVHGVPLDVCARAVYDAVQTFARAASSLQEVHIVDLADEAAGMMSVVFQQLAKVCLTSGF
jgi:O-acetyl-ADP-ribose deacetylase (regulator of RNase III)